MTGNEIRNKFLEYFKRHDHQVVRSASLVPQDDPTLLFTNAGMVPFKRTFLGEQNREYSRAVSSQKCVRAGGKHNDLENVGYTARHHTFFEMLGNFSFGDYFKEKAIEYAWDLIINGYGISSKNLWISIFKEDDEAHNIWQQRMGVPEDRIVRLGEKDNFWSMGDTGPCGPCSEIHIDRGERFGCGRESCQVGCDCDRYLEFWNLVFMQYNRDASGKMTPLPKPSIDTGMGLERIASILQNTDTNYETDLLFPIIQQVETLAKTRYGQKEEADIAMKVISDHSRSTAFLIGDGILPSNEGRGYVLRRILRRAIRYGRNIGLTKPFMHRTAKIVAELMAPAYPELLEASAFITNVIENEEMRFFETLDNGLKLLNDTLSGLKEKGIKEVPGDIIFKLYDTYGFPVDIIEDVTRDEDMILDMAGFDSSMAIQRSQSRSMVSFSGIQEVYKTLSGQGLQQTFVGYGQTSSDARIILLVSDGKDIHEAKEGDEIEIVTDRTPFYGESGGQVGDQGTLHGNDGAANIINTVKDPTGLIIHRAIITSGTVSRGADVTLSVDPEKRAATARNHTATHILHAALRRVLGDHIKQAGSLVGPDRLRFDFTHFSQLSPKELGAIEVLVNDRIRENMPVHIEEMDAEDAFKTGAMALFEEKYGDRVRVISLEDFSKELCGGTHANRTGDIGLFKILGESSIASGVRRMEALTGEAAVEHVQQMDKIIHESALIMREKPEAIPQRLEKLMGQQKALEKEISQLKAKIATMGTDDVTADMKTVNGCKVIAKKVDVDSPAALREFSDKLKDKLQSGVVVLGAISGAKVLLVATVTKDLLGKYHAGDIIKQVAAVVGGGGGGRPDMAQAGGTRPEKLDEALEKVYDLIENY